MFRVVTIGREFGSGGGIIAQKLASRLGWRLIDRNLIDEIARSANVAPELAARCDETLDPWFHRLRVGLWHGGFEGVVTATDTATFDAQTMARITRSVVEEAALMGNCVVVGRGGQCILQKRADTFHVFVYGPMKEKIRRVRERLNAESANREFIDGMDRKRAAYVRRHFDTDWTNPHLYHLMLCSSLGEDAVTSIILCALKQPEERG